MEANIFRILRIGEKEVIMCRFLADLLDPRGWHGCETRFLKSFLEKFNVLKDGVNIQNVRLESTCVMTEYPIGGDRRIDIMLLNPAFAVPIEVKIDTGDRKSQCYDYHAYARNAKLVYLTKGGDPPSKGSIKSSDGTSSVPSDEIRRVSWKEICSWLEKDSETLEQVRQYREAIESFLSAPGKQAKKEQVCKVLEAFQCEIERKAAKRYGLEELSRHSYQEWQNEGLTSFCPGVNYHVTSVVFPRKDSRQMWFRVEVSNDGYLVAGFCLMNVKSGMKVDANTLEEKELEDLCQFLDPLIILPDDWWVTWRYSNGKRDVARDDVPNFKAMNKRAEDLLDTEEREKFVKETVQIFEDQLLGYLQPPREGLSS